MKLWQTVAVIAYVILGIIFAFICDNIANKKGYKEKHFFFVGLIFTVFGYIAACALPERELQEKTYGEIKKLNKTFEMYLDYVTSEEEIEEKPARARESVRMPEPEIPRSNIIISHKPMTERISANDDVSGDDISKMMNSAFFNRHNANKKAEPVQKENNYRESEAKNEEPTPYYPTPTPKKVENNSDQVGYMKIYQGVPVCSICNGAIGLSDRNCPHCGAKIGSSPNASGMGYMKKLD